METVCVTGGAGFLASWLIKCLLERGYWVRATVRKPDDLEKNEHLFRLYGAGERLQLIKADLLDDGSFDEAVNGCQGVFHTASPVITIKDDPEKEMLIPAIQGTLNVLKSCAKSASVKRVVLTSSTAAVRFIEDFPANRELDESVWSSQEFCIKHKLWYHLAKTIAEKTAWKFAKENHLNLLVVLPSFVIGPTLPSTLSSTAFDVLNLLKGDTKKFAMHSRMGYVHIDDVAKAHILVYEKPEAEGRYICSSIELENHELGELLAKKYPKLPIPIKFPNTTNVPFYVLKTSKISALGLNFKTIEDMFDDCIESFKNLNLL